MESIPEYENKVIYDDDDVPMFHCSITGDVSTEISEVEESSSSHGEICFGTVSIFGSCGMKEAPTLC